MRRLFRIGLLTTLLGSTLAFATPNDLSFKQPGTLTVCSYSEFRPVIYGEGEGYEADLLRAVAELWQVKTRFFPERIYEGIWRLPSRQYTLCDLSAGGISPTLQRMQEGTVFSNMTTRFDQSLLVRKTDYTSGKIVSYRSFKNTPMKIGVVPGTTGEKYAYTRAKENGLPLTVFVQYTSESELLPALRHHKIDAIARGEIGNKYQASLSNEFVMIAKKPCDEGFAFAVDRNNMTLATQLNAAISALTDNGKITFDDWFKDHTVFSRRARELLVMNPVPAPRILPATSPAPVAPTLTPAKPVPAPEQRKIEPQQPKQPDMNPAVVI